MAESKSMGSVKRLNSIVLSPGDEIFAFGHNGFGQLDQTEGSKPNKPVLINLNVKCKNIVRIFATWRFTMIGTDQEVILLGSLDPSGKNQIKTINLNSPIRKIIPTNNENLLAGLSFDGKLTLIDIDKSESCGTIIEMTTEVIDFWLTHGGLLICKTSYSLFNSPRDLTGVPFPLDKGVVVQHVSCGHSHSAILTTGRMVYTYGVGTKGELGHGTLESRESPVLLEALAGLQVIQLSAGGWHNLALTEIGDVYSWGWNESGQLGLGIDVQVISTPTLLPLQLQDDKIEFKGVTCGSRHSCSLTRQGGLYTWGWGAYGQLGHGDFANQSSPKLLNHNTELDDVRYTIVDVVAGHWNTFIITKRK